MPRLASLLLILGLLAAQSPNIFLAAAELLSSDPAARPTTDSGWEMDPDGSTTSRSEESPDSGWEMDPNG